MPDRSNQSGAIMVRDAQVLDAPAMGRLMVTTWMRAHRSHIPPDAWQRRQASWTPEVSAAGWERHLRQRDADPGGARACYLVAEDLAGSGLGEQCGEVGPRVDPFGQEVAVLVEESFASKMAAEFLVEALRFDVGGEDADVQGADPDGMEPGGEVLEQLSPKAVTLMIGVDVQRPDLTGGARRVVCGDGCGGDRDQ